MITPLDQPMDPLDNMAEEEVKALDDWEGLFRVQSQFSTLESINVQTKYIYVGALVEPGQKPSDKV